MVELEYKTETFTEKEHIKLEKNSRGFNWEIKLFAIPTPRLDDSGNKTGEFDSRIESGDIERLERLNLEMQKKFGGYTE